MYYFLIIFVCVSNILFANFVCVDSTKLIQKSVAYIDLMKKLDDLHEQHKRKFLSVENALQERHKSLIEGRDKMSTEEFESKTKEYQKDAEAFRTRILQLRKSYEDLRAAGLKEINQNAERLSQALMDREKYSAILEKSAIYLNKDLVDITERLLEELNKLLPQIHLESSKLKD